MVNYETGYVSEVARTCHVSYSINHCCRTYCVYHAACLILFSVVVDLLLSLHFKATSTSDYGGGRNISVSMLDPGCSVGPTTSITPLSGHSLRISHSASGAAGSSTTDDVAAAQVLQHGNMVTDAHRLEQCIIDVCIDSASDTESSQLGVCRLCYDAYVVLCIVFDLFNQPLSRRRGS